MSWVIPSLILMLHYLQTIAVKKEMIEKLQEIIDKLSAIAPEIPVGVPPALVVPPPTVIVTEPKRNNRYHIFDIDLTDAHTDEPLGIQELVKVHDVKFCTYMTILAVPSAFTYKINAKEASVCDAVVGDEWYEFEIEEIYITNTVGTGTGRVHVEFRVD